METSHYQRFRRGTQSYELSLRVIRASLIDRFGSTFSNIFVDGSNSGGRVRLCITTFPPNHGTYQLFFYDARNFRNWRPDCTDESFASEIASVESLVDELALIIRRDARILQVITP